MAYMIRDIIVGGVAVAKTKRMRAAGELGHGSRSKKKPEARREKRRSHRYISTEE